MQFFFVQTQHKLSWIYSKVDGYQSITIKFDNLLPRYLTSIMHDTLTCEHQHVLVLNHRFDCLINVA